MSGTVTDSSVRTPWLVAAVLLAVATAFIAYRATMLPGFDFGDTAAFQDTGRRGRDHAAPGLPALLRDRLDRGARRRRIRSGGRDEPRLGRVRRDRLRPDHLAGRGAERIGRGGPVRGPALRRVPTRSGRRR